MQNSDRKTIDADKAILHLTFAGRRLLIAHIVTCIAFIIAIVFFTTQNTQREEQIINLITNLHCADVVAEVQNGPATK